MEALVRVGVLGFGNGGFMGMEALWALWGLGFRVWEWRLYGVWGLGSGNGGGVRSFQFC